MLTFNEIPFSLILCVGGDFLACPFVFQSIVLETVFKSHLPADSFSEFSIIKFGIFYYFTGT